MYYTRCFASRFHVFDVDSVLMLRIKTQSKNIGKRLEIALFKTLAAFAASFDDVIISIARAALAAQAIHILDLF